MIVAVITVALQMSGCRLSFDLHQTPQVPYSIASVHQNRILQNYSVILTKQTDRMLLIFKTLYV